MHRNMKILKLNVLGEHPDILTLIHALVSWQCKYSPTKRIPICCAVAVENVQSSFKKKIYKLYARLFF